jgi:hypothetical protein
MAPAERSPVEIAAEIAVLHARIEAGLSELRRRAARLRAQPVPGRLLRLLGGLARLVRAARGPRARTAGSPRKTPGL